MEFGIRLVGPGKMSFVAKSRDCLKTHFLVSKKFQRIVSDSEYSGRNAVRKYVDKDRL